MKTLLITTDKEPAGRVCWPLHTGTLCGRLDLEETRDVEEPVSCPECMEVARSIAAEIARAEEV